MSLADGIAWENKHGANPKDAHGDRKPPLHLLPAAFEVLTSMALRHGAITKGYGIFNWRSKSPRVSVYVGACKRHLAAWFDGEDIDPESGVSHLGHAAASLAILIDALELNSAIDDRPPAGQGAELIRYHTALPQNEIGDVIEIDDEPDDLDEEGIFADDDSDEAFLTKYGWSLVPHSAGSIWCANATTRADWPKLIREASHLRQYWTVEDAAELQDEINESKEVPDVDKHDTTYLRSKGWENWSALEDDKWTVQVPIRSKWPEWIQRELSLRHTWTTEGAIAVQEQIDESSKPLPAPHEFMEQQPAFGERPPVAEPVKPIDSGNYPIVAEVYPHHTTMSRGQLLQALDNELADVQMVAAGARKVFDHVTGGKVSKPNTDPTMVCALADDECTKVCEEETATLKKLIRSQYYEVEAIKHEKGAMRTLIREARDNLEFGRDGDAIEALEKAVGKS